MRSKGVPLSQDLVGWRRELVDVVHVETRPILDHDEPLTEDWADWRSFKSRIAPGDEIWTFRSPQEEWDAHMGWQGLLLLRQGALVEFLVTAQN